jgi:hypothetical protein
MPTALAQISVLIVVLILASVSSAFDVGNCNSCPSDCDVTYMAVGGDVKFLFEITHFFQIFFSFCSAILC